MVRANEQTGDDVSSAPHRRLLVTAFLLGAVGIACEATLWRSFSSVLPYHLSFALIGLAPLGAAAGAWLVSRTRSAGTNASSAMDLAAARACLGLTALLLAGPIMLVRLDYTAVGATRALAVQLGGAAFVVLALFAALGAAYAVLASRRDPPIAAAALFGIAAGSAAGAVALGLAPAPTLLFALCVPAGLATAAVTPSTRIRRGGLVLTVIGALVLVASRGTGLLYLPPHHGGAEAVPIFERWTPTTRVAAYAPPADADWASIFADRFWLPAATQRKGKFFDPKTLLTGAQSIAYELTDPKAALIVGGGGRDVWTATAAEVPRIDVFEFDAATVTAAEVALGDIAGRPYSAPGVTVRSGRPRSLLAASDVRYDVIQLPFALTLSGDPLLGFLLHEGSLYTVDAFEEMFDHLAPRGVLAVSQAVEGDGGNAMRATVLALAALERRGVHEPHRNVVVVLASHFFENVYATVLVRLEPFTEAEVRRIEDLALDRAEGLAFTGGGPYFGEWQELGDSPNAASFCATRPNDLCAPSDDRPFFLQTTRLGQLGRRPPFAASGVDPLWSLVAGSSLAFVCCLAIVATNRPPRSHALLRALHGVSTAIAVVFLVGRLDPWLGSSVASMKIVLPGIAVLAAALTLWMPRGSDAVWPSIGTATNVAGTAAFCAGIGLGWTGGSLCAVRLGFTSLAIPLLVAAALARLIRRSASAR